MIPVVVPDVSEYQRPVNWRYKGRWLIFRACDGDYVDQNVRTNLAWCVARRAKGKMDGFTVYVVYRPGQNQTILRILDQLGVPTDCVLMIDGENWGGQIQGNHSGEMNELARLLRARQGGRSDLVWAYGNRGPDLEIWPVKPAWLGWVVASYGGSKPQAAGMIGWQYTNGQWQVPGLPTSTAPFGHCDHNVIYSLPAKPAPPEPKPPVPIPDPVTGKELTLTPEEKAYFDAKFAAVDQSLRGALSDSSGKPHLLRTWLSKLAGKKVDITKP